MVTERRENVRSDPNRSNSRHRDRTLDKGEKKEKSRRGDGTASKRGEENAGKSPRVVTNTLAAGNVVTLTPTGRGDTRKHQFWGGNLGRGKLKSKEKAGKRTFEKKGRIANIKIKKKRRIGFAIQGDEPRDFTEGILFKRGKDEKNWDHTVWFKKIADKGWEGEKGRIGMHRSWISMVEGSSEPARKENEKRPGGASRPCLQKKHVR